MVSIDVTVTTLRFECHPVVFHPRITRGKYGFADNKCKKKCVKRKRIQRRIRNESSSSLFAHGGLSKPGRNKKNERVPGIGISMMRR